MEHTADGCASEMVESGHCKETGQNLEKYSNEFEAAICSRLEDTEAPADEHHAASAILAVNDTIRNSASLFTPDLVADSPRPGVLKDTLNELFLVDDASVIELKEDVEEKFLALEKSIAIAYESQQHSQPRRVSRSPMTTIRARQSYDVNVGSRCTLCGEKLGHNLQSVLDHVKSHIHSRNRPSLECEDCKIKFAFKLDLQMHSNKQQAWSLSRELPPVEDHDPSDWVAKACLEAREAFVSLLRSWETLQLHWYLTAINNLCEKEKHQQAKYKSDMPRFLRWSLNTLGFRNSDFTPTGTYDERHISMNTLIQKFSSTSLVADNEPSVQSLKQAIVSSKRATRGTLGLSSLSILQPAVQRTANPFDLALEKVQVEDSDDVTRHCVLKSILPRVCHEGQFLIVQGLLNSGVNVAAISVQGYDALGYAMRFCIERGANTPRCGFEIDSMVYYEYRKRLVDFIPQLLQRVADIDRKDLTRSTSVTLTTNDGDLEVAKILDKSDASIPHLSADVYQSVLHYAAARDHVELVRLLLDWRAPIDKRDISGNTALMEATCAGYWTVVKLLLERGASMSVRNQFGKDVFQLADDYSRDRIGELLLAENKRRCGSQTVI